MYRGDLLVPHEVPLENLMSNERHALVKKSDSWQLRRSKPDLGSVLGWVLAGADDRVQRGGEEEPLDLLRRGHPSLTELYRIHRTRLYNNTAGRRGPCLLGDLTVRLAPS